MEKPAATDLPLHDLIRRRWSPLAFASKPVEPEKIHAIFEAARWSPSCFNEQPWSFVLATRDDEAGFKKLLGCLVEANQVWAKDAPVLFISVAKLKFTHNNNPNRHGPHDVGLATENLILQALSMGLWAHAMAGFDADKFRKEYNVPADYEPMAAVAVGYPGEPDQLDEKYKQRELSARSRKPASGFVFGEAFGKPQRLFAGRS